MNTRLYHTVPAHHFSNTWFSRTVLHDWHRPASSAHKNSASAHSGELSQPTRPLCRNSETVIAAEAARLTAPRTSPVVPHTNCASPLPNMKRFSSACFFCACTRAFSKST